MKSKTKLIIGGTFLALLGTITIVYATNASLESTTEEVEQVSQASISMSENILEELDSSTDELSTSVMFDELENKNFYVVENEDYSIRLSTDNQLRGIYSKEISTEQTISNYTKDSAEEYILNKYASLDLPEEYELYYLEKYDDLIWLASFEKNYDGLYNKYESVKVFFIPDTDEIISLTRFNEAPSSSDVTVSEESAIETTLDELNLDSSDIVSANLEMQKADDSEVHSTWTIQTADNTIVYVDANTNTIIGGDYINE